jgi:rifampin ADP-ribosylating transferase
MTYAIDATGPFYHGARAQLAPGDLLAPGNRSNCADR